MNFNELVLAISKKYLIATKAVANSPHISDVVLYDNAQTFFEPDVLYFVLEAAVDGGTELPLQIIVADDFLLSDASDHCVASVSRGELLSVYNYTRKVLQAGVSEGLFQELCAAADNARSLQSIINLAASKLGDPIVFCDMEFSVVASSSTIPVVDPLWVKNIAKGYCSYDFIEGVKALESVKSAELSADAHEVTCDRSPCRKITSKVLSQGMQIGFVLMFGSETPISPAHFDMLRQVSEAITYSVRNYAPYLLKSIDRYQQLIYNLLIGASPEDIKQSKAALSLPNRMAAICIRPTRHLGDKHLKNVTIPAFQKLFPQSHAVCYEGCIAVLFPMNSGVEPEDETLDALNSFAEGNHIFCGISYSFSSIEGFARHYAKAMAAFKLINYAEGKQHKSVLLYRDYIMYDLLGNTLAEINVGAMCHPALQLLRENDSETGGELYKTLQCFVDNSGRMNETASELFIHRNSLGYRMAHIRELTGLDLDDIGVRFALKLSFDIDRFTYKGS